MRIPNLSSQPEPVRKIIHEQGAARLESQCAFAVSQDSRAVTLISAAASLAAAAAGIAIAASTSADRTALVWAAGTATVGFAATAATSLFSLRSRGFHSKGWFPHDFIDDLASGKDAASIDADLIEDLEIRLRHNSSILLERGRLFNFAAWALAATPIVALLVGLLAA